MRFKKTTLANGIRVVSEMQPESRAAALGVWVLSGTRDEASNEAGISHFLEHMVFKGTKNRTAFQIAKSLEELGGELNAYTTREYTCYHAFVLKDHWRVALDVLSDLVNNMQLKKSDFEVERSVILQEIAMGDDSQEDMIYDHYFDKAFGKHPLGRPILGNQNSIAKMNMKQVRDRYEQHYSGPNLIISAAGDLEHQDLVSAVEKALKRKKKTRFKVQRSKPRHAAIREVVERPGEQLHLLMGLPVTSFKDKYRFEAFIVNALLGGGMTSKLYQKVREKKGLVYTIYSSLNTFVDYGLINIYAACEPKNMVPVIKNIQTEVRALKERGVRASDIELFKTQVKGSLLLGSDDVENRMSSIGVNEMVFQEYRPVERVIEEIEAVTPKTIKEFMREYYDMEKWGLVLLGAEAESHREMIENLTF
ncbi:MAG: M16 family metallopeptidase [Bdellovibrio sp.]|jgi:predicted Zn-dependent peptidase